MKTLLVILLGTAPIAAPAKDGPPSLAWMIGTWCDDPGDGDQTCETWTGYDRRQRAHGVSITHGPIRTTRETMTIVSDDGRLVLHAEPQGQPPADFASTEGDYAPGRLEFVNKAHGYPQRIRYWREGALLVAEIAMADGSSSQRWTYHRAKSPGVTRRVRPIRSSRAR